MSFPKKNTPITSESNKGKVFELHSKDTKKETQIDLIDLENDYLKLKEKNKNPFPVDTLPKNLQEVVYECFNKYQFSLDYIGSGILAASSASIGRSYKVKVKHGWNEKANLFMVIVGLPGDSKSHALNFCFKPIHIKENFLFKEYKEALDEYNKSNLENLNEKLKKPFLKKYLLNDFTPEALILYHYYNKRSIYVYVDELLGLLKNFNRYSNSGESEAYLSFWSGTATSSDRVSSNSLRLDDPFIGVIGSTQISTLKEFSKDGRNLNGFMDRFLFVYPFEQKTVKWNINRVDETILQNYFAVITNLMELEGGINGTSTKSIPIEKSAKEYLFNWQNNRSVEKLFPYERGIEIKLQQYVIRFALILQLLHHVVDNKSNEKIEMFAVKGAIRLFHYFYDTAIRVRQESIKKYYLETLTELQLNIYMKLKKEFTTKEGIEVACILVDGKPRISERQFKTFLKDTKLFKRVSHGKYEKLL